MGLIRTVLLFVRGILRNRLDRDFPFAASETAILRHLWPDFKSERQFRRECQVLDAKSGPFFLVGALRRAFARHPARHEP